MRFLLGVWVGYRMRLKGKQLLLILIGLLVFVDIIFPAISLSGLALSVNQRRATDPALFTPPAPVIRPAQTPVPALSGLKYHAAETKLRASYLNIEPSTTTCDFPLQPAGTIIDQDPPPGTLLNHGATIRVTLNETTSCGPGP